VIIIKFRSYKVGFEIINNLLLAEEQLYLAYNSNSIDDNVSIIIDDNVSI